MAQENELELHVQTTAHATIITCQLPGGSSFSKIIDRNIEELPEEERNKIIKEASMEAHMAYTANLPKEDFATLVKKALERKEKKRNAK